MKKIIVPLVVGILLVRGAQAQVSLPFYDGFNYGAGGDLAGNESWTAASGSGTIKVNAGNLIYSNLQASVSNDVTLIASSSAVRTALNFATQSNGTLYVSFLLKVNTVPSAQRLVGYVYHSTSSSSTPDLGFFVNATPQLLVGLSTSSPQFSTAITTGPTYLIVVGYTFGTSSDSADVWFNPTTLGTNAPAPDATFAGTHHATLTHFLWNTVGTSSGGGAYEVDELRIGNTYAEVTPAASAPPPPPPPSNPVITETLLAPDGRIVLRGMGGAPTGTYEVITTTDIGTPLETWDSLATSQFDVSGNFDITNPVSPSDLQRFYRVLVAGTNAPVEAPAITNQPQDQIVHEGETAVFSVGATGSTLNYQWYFNTNSPLSLATNSVLTISNVQSNNIGTYSVVVSNSAGSAASTYASLTIGEPVTNGDYYVSASGNDGNDGSYAHPFFSLQKAQNLAQPGDTIYIRGNAGHLMYSSTIRLTNSGTALAPINLLAYLGEHPVLNFTNQPYGSSNRGVIIELDTVTGVGGNYWYIKGLEIAFAGDNGLKIEGSHNTVEQCVFHHNGDTGLQIGFAHETDNPGTWGAYNTIINCDSYMNYDQDNRGQDADGFACKLHPGPGNMFIGCRAWKNSDDGYDLFETDDSVILSNCWAWHSGDGSLYNVTGGSFQGNGNGIKLGGNGSGGSSMGIHYAINCIAFNCSYKSNAENFTNNSHDDGLRIYNCLAFNPGSSGYNFFIEGAGSDAIMKNNVSFPRGTSTTGVSIDSGVSQNNTWNLSVSANSSDYGNLTEAAAEAPRGPDGSLPTGFARLVAGSDLINAGVDVGLPYCESAPDLGPIEYCP